MYICTCVHIHIYELSNIHTCLYACMWLCWYCSYGSVHDHIIEYCMHGRHQPSDTPKIEANKVAFEYISYGFPCNLSYFDI